MERPQYTWLSAKYYLITHMAESSHEIYYVRLNMMRYHILAS